MKNVVIFIALVVLSKPLWPLVEYTINYDYIVTELCENKDKPELQCNGKCYLTKQLAEETAGDEKNPFSNNSQKTEIPQFIIAEKIREFHFSDIPTADSHESSGIKPNLYTTPFISEILHPPRA